MNANSLNVLYQSSDLYSMITGVSIASLCYNNQGIPEINIFLLNDGISQGNLKRIQDICDKYQRKLVLIDGEAVRHEIKKTGFPIRHGSYGVFYKYFVMDKLDEEGINRILYLDSDTIVDKPLSGLLRFDLGDENPMALSRCFHVNWQKERIGRSDKAPYFTPGVMLVDIGLYKEKDYLDRFLAHQDEGYAAADEEILNIEFGDEIKILPLQYNFFPNFYEYGVENMYKIYDLDASFASKAEVKKIMSDGPYILHCLDTMSGRPWEKGNRHPYNAKFNEYLALTEWTEDDKFEVNKNRIRDMQKIAFRILPSGLYCKLHRLMFEQAIKKGDKQAAEGVISTT